MPWNNLWLNYIELNKRNKFLIVVYEPTKMVKQKHELSIPQDD